MNKLEEICEVKRQEVARRKTLMSQAELDRRAAAATAPRGFARALLEKSREGFGLIAEIKRASPSKGLIRADFDPAAHAADYQAGGAACLSVLTDEPYFQGHDDYLVAARAACALPCLRKDFMVDVWQIAESRALGADAVLVIVAALDDATMAEIESAAIDHGMDVLVEVHDEAEMERALKLRSPLIGINNRDLRSFVTDIATTERLVGMIPEGRIAVSESGINSHADCTRLSGHGVRCFLVGESLMRQPDVTVATRALLTGAAA
ncbi:MAG: indole-3-glycerol-phosphate synthase [Blastomonas sp. CACIA14H2]|uniref:indole-3-glycerol phosphate synthase TrpC n=1 Tax=Blastomonas sp. CACIA14H2 TaxID=1419876 RepID=UPI0003CFA0A8|nr:MAG: indole-3-glycerol-phosphate synthase [Blastomonas sp. CACIA14H2]